MPYLSGKIVFSSGKQGDYDLWCLDMQAGKLQQLTYGSCWNDKPRWSADGEWVVFVSNAAGTPDIYKLQIGRREVIPVVQNGRWNDFPAFSPDGRQIGYVSNASGNNDVFIADADGRNPERVTSHEGSDATFSWMPDGQSILLSSEMSGNADIWRIDLKTGDKQQLTTDKGMDIYPAPSPDGKYVAFVSNRQFDPSTCRTEWSDRDLAVYVMDIDGKHKARVTENQGSDRCVAWSPDGQYLIYTASSPDSAAERLRIMDVRELLLAFEGGSAESIEYAADKLRTSKLGLDRRDLEAEIDARRHTFFLTSLLPDYLVRPMYGEAYFGSERYPHWIDPASASKRHIREAATRAGL